MDKVQRWTLIRIGRQEYLLPKRSAKGISAPGKIQFPQNMELSLIKAHTVLVVKIN
jgi:hypothetical protein